MAKTPDYHVALSYRLFDGHNPCVLVAFQRNDVPADPASPREHGNWQHSCYLLSTPSQLESAVLRLFELVPTYLRYLTTSPSTGYYSNWPRHWEWSGRRLQRLLLLGSHASSPKQP